MQIWLLACLIGGLAGLITPAAWWVIFRAGEWFYTVFNNKAEGNSLLYAISLPTLVGVVIFLLMYIFRGFRSADGFTYFIADLHFQDGRRKVRYSFVHGLSSFLLVFGQAVVGIEGFCLEVLSAVSSRLGTYLKLTANQVRTLAACGTVSAIAAMLGQPTAAFLFVAELLYGWGSLNFSIGTCALAAFVASSVSQSLTSPSGIFGSLFGSDAGLSLAVRSESFELSTESAVVFVLAISVSAALLSAFTIWLHRKTDKDLHDLFETRRATDFSIKAFALRLALWALLTSCSLYFFPEALGVGVQLLHDSLSQGFLVKVTILAMILRILLSAMAYTVIGSMGLILPTLVLGGLLGSIISHYAHGYFAMSSGTVALLSMGAVFSASFGTPVAATALVVSYASGLVNDSALFLFAALLTNFAAHFLCGLFQKDRLASMGLYRHGIRFRNGMCYNTLSGIQVKDAMITYANPIPGESSIGDAYKKLMESKFFKLPVIGAESDLKGMVSLADFYGLDAWKKLGEESQVHHLVGVNELMKPARDVLSPEMNLESALLSMKDEELLPVVESGKYVGLLMKSDLVNLYNKEVVKKAFRR